LVGIALEATFVSYTFSSQTGQGIFFFFCQVKITIPLLTNEPVLIRGNHGYN